MPQLGLRRTILLAALGWIAAVAALGAQEAGRPPAAARVIDAVIRYRMAWMADSARFDACSVAEWTGSTASEHTGVSNPERVLLGRAGERCVRGRVSLAARSAAHVVVVDSVALLDSSASVQLTVRHGEYTHREAFTLILHPGPGTWGVRDVRLRGAVQSSPPRRPLP
jgi:hypothetical protein